jgi:hypothetical protein
MLAMKNIWQLTILAVMGALLAAGCATMQPSGPATTASDRSTSDRMSGVEAGGGGGM